MFENGFFGYLKTLNFKKCLFWIAIFISLSTALAARIPFFLKSDFALNDGGLFVEMTRSIVANDFILPESVIYNSTEIPFAYPALSFYAVAFMSTLFDWDILSVARYLPLGFNLLGVFAFVLFVSRELKTPKTLIFTAALFPLLPKSYEWLIMGGGISRSVGFFFALMSLCAASYLAQTLRVRYVLVSAVFLALTIMSHLEWAITAAVSCSLLLLSKRPLRLCLPNIALLGALSILFSAPWWASVISDHGIEPFFAASKTAEWKPMTWSHLSDSIGSVLRNDRLIFTVPVAIGGCLLLFRREWFVPVWLIAIYLTTPRHGPTAASMPHAILISVGLLEGLFPLFQSWLNSFKRLVLRRTKIVSYAGRVVVSLGISMIATTAAAGIVTLVYTKSQTLPSHHTPLISLTENERNAMEWIKNHTFRSAKFIVLSDSLSWQDDRVAEWFPVLAQRKSLTTVQGLEWVRGDVFGNYVSLVHEIKQAQSQKVEHLNEVLEQRFQCFDFVAIFNERLGREFARRTRDGIYKKVFADNNVTIFKRRGQKSCEKRLSKSS